MKALILAGGRGTRLRPLTHTSNKHSIPIANRPMLFRVVDDAVDLGINHVIINLNKGDTEIPRLIDAENKSNWKVKIDYIEQPKPNGMMYPIKLAEKLIGNEEFFFSAGDNILSGGLQTHYADFKKKKSDGHVLVVKRDDYQNFGVAVIKHNKVVRTVEKPKKFVSDLVLTAIYFFTPAVFESFDYIKPIDPKNTGTAEYYPPPVINWMIKKGYKFTASEITGYWKDTGTFDSLLDANQLVLDMELRSDISGKVDKKTSIQGRVQIAKGARVKNSVLRGPLSIANGAFIEDSYIGPYTSIGEDCKVVNSHIENSILLENVLIEDHKPQIDSSIFGYGATLIRDGNSNGSRYMIGDDSVVRV